MAEKLAFSIKEAAESIGVSVPIMRELSRRADFPVIAVGRRRLIPVDQFKCWLGSQSSVGLEV